MPSRAIALQLVRFYRHFRGVATRAHAPEYRPVLLSSVAIPVAIFQRASVLLSPMTIMTINLSALRVNVDGCEYVRDAYETIVMIVI